MADLVDEMDTGDTGGIGPPHEGADMFVANDLQIRIANDRLEELRRQADDRRRVRLARRAAATRAVPAARPPATVHTIEREPALSTCAPAEGRAA